MTTKPKKAPDKKASLAEARAKLAAGAKQIHGVSKPAKRVIDNTNGELPEIDEVTADVKSIITKCVILDPEHPAVSLKADTTIGESLAIFDYFKNQSDGIQFIVGDLILEMEKLPAFKGPAKFRDLMLATSRSLDSLKAYKSVALNTPPSLRLLPYTHTRALQKIPKLEDRSAAIHEAAELAKKGNLPSVQELSAKADKFAPRKTKGKKAVITIVPKREATPEEEAVLKELEENGKVFASHLEMSDFLHNLSEKHVAKIRDILKRLNATYLRMVT